MFVSPFELPGPSGAIVPFTGIKRAERLEHPGELWHVKGLLPAQQLDSLLEAAAAARQLPVGADGILAHYEAGPVGSYRCSAYDERWAEILWEAVREALPETFFAVRHFGETDHVDAAGQATWIADGVNPLLRFIHYPAVSGHLIAHYDAPFIESPARRTLYSLVLYLTGEGAQGGETRFLKDPQDRLPFSARSFADWTRNACDEEIALRITPRAGDALIFEHRLLHDGAPLTAGPDKWLLRTDLFFHHA